MMSELLQIRRIVSGGYNTTMKVVNTTPGMNNPMTEEERRTLANDKNELLARIEFIDEKGEPNVIPTGYYFDNKPNAKQRSTEKCNGLFVSEELEGAFI